jgi:DNA-binding beta-propeller fold protein YncE
MSGVGPENKENTMVCRRAIQIVLAAVLLAASLLTGCTPASDSRESAPSPVTGTALRQSGQDWPFGPYQIVDDWPKPLPDDRHSHDGWTWGSMGGVFAESPDRIWIAQRGELPLPEGAEPWTPYAALSPSVGIANSNTDGMTATCQTTTNLRGWERRFEHVIFVVDGEGNLVDEWPQHDALFGQLPCGRGPHSIKMNPYDPEKHVWVIDDQLHVIYRFTYEGELVHTLGELGVRGRGPNNFDRPTDIAWLPDGSYFISDGYGGTRVAKFDANDNFLIDWGTPAGDRANPGPSEFNAPHSIAVSADRRVFVVDRGHQRMQVFDEDGNFQDEWPLRSPYWPDNINTLVVNHIITEDQYIWAGDTGTNRILKFDLDGNFLYSWGAPGGQPGRLACPHGLSTDQDGNFYVADCFAGRVQKFAPQPDADPAKLMGQILRYDER